MKPLRRLLGIVLFFLAPSCFGAIAHVQQASSSDMCVNEYTSLSATFSSPTTNGNAIIVALTFDHDPNFTVTDSQGNTYVQAIRSYDTVHQQGNVVYYSTNIKGGSSNTITVNFDAPTICLALSVHEYSGIAATSAVDVTAGLIATSQTHPSTGSATTTTNGDLIYTVVMDDAVSVGDTYTAGSSFTKRVDLGMDAGFADEDQIQTSAGAVAGTWTLSPSRDTITQMVAFRPSPNGGGASPSISNLSPLSGAVGTTVTASGVFFGATQGSSTVTLSGAVAAVTTSSLCPSGWNNTCVAFVVPNGATSGPALITVGGVPSNGVNFAVTTGTINLVQQASNGTMLGDGFSSFSATFPQLTTNGNTIILAVSIGVYAHISVSDSQNNTYTQAIRLDDYRDNCYNGLAIFYATNIVGGPSNTVTVQFDATVEYIGLGIHEYSEIASVSPLDGTSGNLGTGTSISSGAATTTANGDLIFSAAWEDSVGFGDAFTAGTGFMKLLDLDNEVSYVDADEVQPTAGSVAGTWTMSPSGLNWMATLAAFKAAASAGNAPPSITNLSPSSNSIAGVVTIAGTNFGTTQGSSTVTFNNTPATVTTSSACPSGWSNTCIAVTVPNGAITGPVVVTVLGVASNGVNFTMLANQPPVVTVGPDQTIAYPTNTASLTGTVTDDGYPLGDTLQISWSQLVGPATVIFSNPNQPNTQATFSVPGNYILRLSAFDGQYTSVADTTVIYSAPVGGGIAVSAGPDQVIVFPAAANLTGTASDSNPALAGALTTAWSLVSGPGMVTFGNPSSLATTATFSVSGVYDLRLTATDGVFTASGDVKIYAGNLQCALSNKGTDFWLMFTGILYQTPIPPAPEPPQQIYLFISSDVSTSGTVTVGQGANQTFNQSFTTTPDQITTITLPQSVQMITSDDVDGNGNAQETKGIHVTSQNPVAVYGLNFYPFATDGYLGLPTTTLGTSYVVASYRNTEIPEHANGFGTEFGVTATQDNTTVTIIPTANAGTRDTNHPFGARTAQVPYTIHLNQGQTYQLRNSQDYTPLDTASGPPVDLTGSIVTSDKPVAVFGGHDCTVIPDQSFYCNGLIEQLPPTNLWGQNFVTMPLATEHNGDTFRFIAQTDGTQVQVNHQQVAVLQKGQFFEQLITGPAEISANNPILTVQYANSAIFAANINVDPTMIVVPPFEQFGGSYTINTPTSNFPDNFINVIAPTAAVQASSVILDGNPIPAASFQQIGTSPFSGVQVQATVGPHSLTAGLPFGVWVYGFNQTDAYGYTGGVCLARGVPGITIAASPKSATMQITSQTTIQATVDDPSGQPVGGTNVTFTVAGVNSQTSNTMTNSSGVATFTYTSLKTGSDIITVTLNGTSDTAGVTWISNGTNQPPVVGAGPNQTISLPTNSALLVGSVVDDGLPTGGTLTSSWTQLSGPAAVTFATPNQQQTSVTFSQAGTYVLELTGNDSQLSTSATVTVIVYPPNQPPVVNPGPSQTIVFPNQFITFNGTVTDDRLPLGSTLTIGWSQFSGPSLVTFSSTSTATTAVTFPGPGTYVLQLSASDGQFTTTRSVNAFVLGPPVVTATPNASGVINTPIALQGAVTINGQPPSPGEITMSWGVFTAPTGVSNNASFSNQTSASTNFQTNIPGTYTVGLCAGSTAYCGFTTIYVATTAPVLPSVSIATPLDGAQITAPTQVTGSVSSGNWTLDYALQDDFHPMNFTTLATGTTAVSNGNFATLDPTVLLNGTYIIRLTSVNSAGESGTVSISVNVARNAKVGVFSLSFNDLTVPVSGIPVQVIRSYDSRDKRVGDFGVGWRLSLANIRVQKSRSLSPNWQETQTENGFLPQYCFFATDNKIVTVTFPDGRVFTFQSGAAPLCQLAGQISSGTLTFKELPGPANTGGATLTPADGGQFIVDGSSPGAVSIDGYDGNPFNPFTFILKTADGTKYTLDQQLGLTAITDPNGNTLTITASGITSSTGKSVPFARDDRGRITRITDLNGNTLLYSYNSSGDLIGFTDLAAHQSVYSYDGTHDLTGINTPDGKQVLTNTFDSGGRLTATKDGNGFTVSFSNNVAAQTQTVTDRKGNPTTYVYDADGNITQVTDALGNVTTSTYDANDDKLSSTNALGHTSSYTYDANGNQLTQTDPLNHTATHTYNPLNKPLTVTDANGHTTTNTYDANGNLLTTTDPLGKVTTNTYSPSGLLSSTKDPAGNTTSFGYDGSGNLTSQTDALGTVTTYTYDGNGNRTAQSVTRTLQGGTQQTLKTSYVYDGDGHLLQTTYPDGSTTQTICNTLGQQVTTIDGLGRQTSYQYDSDGHVTLVTYPDGTLENSSYDNNGNRTQFIDRSRIFTDSTYDALNRLTQTTDISSNVLSKTAYDAIGEVLNSTDADGNVTQYTYDSAGRRTTVTDALTHVTTFGYDAAGNQTSVKDANNTITSYVYYNANRRTQVTYPDGKFDTTGYDALGRVTTRTDANGKVIQYGYDGLGRLISVVQDAVAGGLNLLTQYSYDQVGNRVSQTDANNHATTYAYDQLGRRTQRTLPLSQSESYTYGAAGNMLTHTDFNGKTTTFTYDAGNRLLTKVPDPSFSAPTVTYTYSAASGLRHTMTDASGTTTYLEYDNRGRLQEVSKPAGLLSYTYDLAGNLMQLSGPFGVTYTYDKLNRLRTVTDSNTGTTTYAYDNVGNLQSVLYPNGVKHAYIYDTRNRLTNLALSTTSTNLASYAYMLDAAGHRLSVSELSGRTVNYGYDSIYRLTNETIASDPNAVNGAVNYTYDAMGNRKQLSSTLAPVPAGLWNYDANDRFTAGDTYDANGNTVSSGGAAVSYDFENRIIQKAGVTIVYDGDGNRVSKTSAGITTKYLVDTQNPTGYAQVIYELFSGGTGNHEQSHFYVYGLQLISQLRNYQFNVNNITQKIFYDYDGHGSVRALTDPTGAVTDTYDYDAFGNVIHSSTTLSTPTLNNYLFAGEQFDPDLNLYFNRARYLNVSTGRFWSMDTDEGGLFEPLSLHKYLYANSDPVNRIDPSGHDSIAEFDVSFALQATLATIATVALTTVLRDVKSEVGMRLNHYTRWIFLPLIMSGGINNPNGDNYFTPDFYISGAEAKSKLALKVRPELFINLTVYEYTDALHGPTPVAPLNGELGGGQEYSTARIVPFWTRAPILFPLEEEINSILSSARPTD